MDNQRKFAPEVWKKSAMLMINRICEHRHAWVFSKPITNPDYLSIIKRPMDLNTIKKKIKNGVITCETEFKHDLELIFQNAMFFYKPGDATLSMAEEMKRYSLSVLEEMIPLIRSGEFESDTNDIALSSSTDAQNSQLQNLLSATPEEKDNFFSEDLERDQANGNIDNGLIQDSERNDHDSEEIGFAGFTTEDIDDAKLKFEEIETYTSDLFSFFNKVCKNCNKLFTTRKQLTNHLLKTHSKKLVECNNCKSKFKTVSGRNQHLKRKSCTKKPLQARLL